MPAWLIGGSRSDSSSCGWESSTTSETSKLPSDDGLAVNWMPGSVIPGPVVGRFGKPGGGLGRPAVAFVGPRLVGGVRTGSVGAAEAGDGRTVDGWMADEVVVVPVEEPTMVEPAGVEPAGVEPSGVEPAGVEPAGSDGVRAAAAAGVVGISGAAR